MMSEFFTIDNEFAFDTISIVGVPDNEKSVYGVHVDCFLFVFYFVYFGAHL